MATATAADPSNAPAADFMELELDLVTSTQIADVLAAIAAAGSLDALALAIQSAKGWPEADRAKVRPAKLAKESELRAAAKAAQAAKAPATVRQSIPALTGAEVIRQAVAQAHAPLAPEAATLTEALATVQAEAMTNNSATRINERPIATALPVGAGITHTPTGPSIFSVPKSQRALFGKAAAVEVKPVLSRGDVIAGAIAAGRGCLISWAGSGRIERAKLLAALAEINRVDDAPAAKSARAQAGRAALALNGLGFVCRAARRPTPTEIARGADAWPDNVAARWVAGTLNTAAADESLGHRVLTVDLLDDDTLTFTGAEDLAARVRADYEGRCAGDVYTSADLTAWLGGKLRTVHHGAAYGVTYWIPGGQADAAKALASAVSKLWGRAWMRGLPIATEAELIAGLTESLAEEVAEVAASLDAAVEEAKAADRKGVGSRRAATLLNKLADVGERVKGYTAMLGVEATSAIRAQVALLDAAIRPLVDDTAQRGAMIELD